MWKLTIELPYSYFKQSTLEFFIFPKSKLLFCDTATFLNVFNAIPVQNQWINDVLMSGITIEKAVKFLQYKGVFESDSL